RSRSQRREGSPAQRAQIAWQRRELERPPTPARAERAQPAPRPDPASIQGLRAHVGWRHDDVRAVPALEIAMPNTIGASEVAEQLAAGIGRPQSQLDVREPVVLDPRDQALEAARVVVILAEREDPVHA